MESEDTLSEDLGPSPSQVPDVNDSDSSVAAAEMLGMAAGSDTGEDVSIYQLKWVEWKDNFAPIVVQNENGPCPLLALCNVLILTGRIKISPGQTAVSSTYLTDLLGTHLLESHKTNRLSEGEKANLEHNIQDTMAIFPKLQTGLDVNVKFNSASGFEFTRETGVFDLVGVPLYHGWLADPQNSWYQLVKDFSYNQLVEMIINNISSEDTQLQQQAIIGQDFLEATASQLTYHGICELNRKIREGELCVFFRNNHFNTLMKKKGNLLTLVTDHGFLNEMGYVWQLLSDIDGGGEFLDAHFHLSPHSQSQQNRAESSAPSSESSPTKRTTPTQESRRSDKLRAAPNPDLDFQTALSLQEQEYKHQEQDQATAMSLSPPASVVTPGSQQQELIDRELAVQLQQELESQDPPPNTHQECERASQTQHPRRAPSKSDSCIII